MCCAGLSAAGALGLNRRGGLLSRRQWAASRRRASVADPRAGGQPERHAVADRDRPRAPRVAARPARRRSEPEPTRPSATAILRHAGAQSDALVLYRSCLMMRQRRRSAPGHPSADRRWCITSVDRAPVAWGGPGDGSGDRPCAESRPTVSRRGMGWSSGSSPMRSLYQVPRGLRRGCHEPV